MKKASVFCTQQARVKASHASTKNIYYGLMLFRGCCCCWGHWEERWSRKKKWRLISCSSGATTVGHRPSLYSPIKWIFFQHQQQQGLLALSSSSPAFLLDISTKRRQGGLQQREEKKEEASVLEEEAYLYSGLRGRRRWKLLHFASISNLPSHLLLLHQGSSQLQCSDILIVYHIHISTYLCGSWKYISTKSFLWQLNVMIWCR